MRRRPWDDEADAAQLICAHVGGVARQIDPGGGANQVHDFDVNLPDGTTIAVEVTRHNVPGTLAVLSEVDKRDWHFPDLRDVWVVDMIPVYNVSALHREIGGLLRDLEAARVDRLLVRSVLFDATLDDQSIDIDERDDRRLLDRTGTRETVGRLRDLGVRLVYRWIEGGPGAGEVIVGQTSQAGSTASSTIVEMVERLAIRPDNVKKLESAGDRTERHLFAWVETSQHSAVAAFAFSELPDGAGLPERAPRLPGAIDAVWAVTAFDPAHAWHYHRRSGWRDLGTWRRPT